MIDNNQEEDNAVKIKSTSPEKSNDKSLRRSPGYVSWLSIFQHYIWFGLLLIFLAILIQVSYSDLGIYLQATLETIKTVGIAIVVAALFSYAAGTTSFIEKIEDFLRDIIVSLSQQYRFGGAPSGSRGINQTFRSRPPNLCRDWAVLRYVYQAHSRYH